MKKVQKVDIQIKLPKGWKTVCTVDSLDEHIFQEFVNQQWKHLDRRITTAGDEKVVWDRFKASE
ncbi:hypothetical protein [Virgibacillus siamensis]|uniref:hypothetical protein n=1 Tax=Virgibacillus siamensis TaxID=480071 RepID=UPI000984E7BA|nr:hypothetical protein [Virgibacillus siamensis]